MGKINQVPSAESHAATAFTIGHSTRAVEDFVAMLKGHGVRRLVDVRTVPRSRTNPQFNKETLPISLAPHGIGHVHVPELGGLRKPKPDSPNGGWRNLSFRGYADHMQTEEFARALEKAMEWIAHERIAFMCAEAVPWRCHRSLIADALTVRGIVVHEIASATKTQVHKMISFAKVDGLRVTYPPLQPELIEPGENE
ncbi:MAG TPA: DUF488 domain-containing protein [Methylomirabilota bacterium]|nr:DUF488 domain-containing protein [Methylomirabilota bacterium]